MSESHQHVFSRYSKVLKTQEPIIFHVESKLHAKVSNLDTWKRLMVFISNSYNKSLNPLVFTINYQSGNNYWEIGMESQLARPELVRRDCGRVKNNLISLGIVGGCCLNALDICTVSELCLSVGSVNFEIVDISHPLFLLVLCGQILNHESVHIVMQHHRCLSLSCEKDQVIHLKEVQLCLRLL